MDYITRHYKTLSENLQRKLNLLEAMMAQAAPPAGTSPTAPMGPPSPAPAPAPGTPPSSTPSPTTPFPPPPNPGMYPRGVKDPAYFQDYYKWLQEFNKLPPDHPARRGRMPAPPVHTPKKGPRPGGGTFN